MKNISILILLVFFSFKIQAQSMSVDKVIRVNIHFMLRTNGTGNFTETTDGDGRTWYNGYTYANELIDRMNVRNDYNERMNIPTGNTTPILTKNFHYVIDAVYFIRNDAYFNFESGFGYYSTFGADKNNVMNIVLNYCPANDGSCASSGQAFDMSYTGKNKLTENQTYWQNYVLWRNGTIPFGWFIDATAINTNHELGHLLGLSHTVQQNDAPPCPTGCPGWDPINLSCDDGCDDTPTAWSITASNGCTKHPACGWSSTPAHPIDCSNNIMDYNNGYALTPCQLTKIHTGLVGGMKTYLVCDAVSYDLTLNDIGYPKLAYFGKNVIIGNTTSLATVTNEEKIKLYFSSSVELNNFEVRADSEFEVIQEAVCSF